MCTGCVVSEVQLAWQGGNVCADGRVIFLIDYLEILSRTSLTYKYAFKGVHV